MNKGNGGLELKFAASRYIIKWYRLNEHHSIFVEGDQGIGKTTYSVKILADIYGWNKVLNYLFFKPLDALRFAEKIHPNRVPVIVMDDAGVWLNKYRYKEREVQYYLQYIQLLRNTFSCIIYTTPDKDLLLKDLRRMRGSYTVAVMKRTTDRGNMRARLAKAYRLAKLPSGAKRVNHAWQDKFSALMPDEIYKEYTEMRVEYEKFLLRRTRKAWEYADNIQKEIPYTEIHEESY